MARHVHVHLYRKTTDLARRKVRDCGCGTKDADEPITPAEREQFKRMVQHHRERAQQARARGSAKEAEAEENMAKTYEKLANSTSAKRLSVGSTDAAPFPTMQEAETASYDQLKKWVKSLPRPRNDEERDVLDIIIERWEER